MINYGKETEKLEFKKSTSEINEAINSIVAMLNKSGSGKILFGVKNNGDGIGQQISENTLRDISCKIYEDIKPTIYPSIYELENAPGIIVVEFNGNDRPYSSKGKFYIRSYDEDRQMDINTLLKQINHTDKSNALWEQMETSESIDDIDEELLVKYIRKANNCGRITQEYTSKKEVLTKLGLLTNNFLNNAGRILFSKNKPLTLQLAVFKTDEKLSFIDITRYEGNLFELIDKGYSYIKEHINYGAEIVGNKRIERPEIPEEAIREVVMNSLCHSSFDMTINNQIYITPTRVVVFNPGSFPDGYEPIDFAYNGVESVLRNPLIAKILYYSNDIDSWATGFRRIFKYCEEYNVKTSYKMKNQGFEFTFMRTKNKVKTDLEAQIIMLIKEKNNITIDEIALLTSKSKRTIQNKINEMKENKKIERLGSNRKGTWHIIKES